MEISKDFTLSNPTAYNELDPLVIIIFSKYVQKEYNIWGGSNFNVAEKVRYAAKQACSAAIAQFVSVILMYMLQFYTNF